METNRLRHFVTVVELGTLTKAAEFLGISTSGLSKVISALENECHLKLFRPHGRGLEITEEGKWFYKKAIDIIRITNEMTQSQRAIPRCPRIGLSEALAVTCSAQIAKDFVDALSLTTIDVGDAEGQIIAGHLDFAIAFVPAPRPELQYLKIGDVRFTAVARTDLIKSSNPIRDIPFAVPNSDIPENTIGYRNRDGWQLNEPRRCKYFVSSFEIALSLLQGGLAAVYMPAFYVKQISHRSDFSVIEDFKKLDSVRNLYLIKSKSSDETREMKKVCRTIRGLIAKG